MTSKFANFLLHLLDNNAAFGRVGDEKCHATRRWTNSFFKNLSDGYRKKCKKMEALGRLADE
jgi:hypothetical protein